MALRNHWSRHDRCCWGRTGFLQLGGGAGRAGTCAVCRPLLAGKASSLRKQLALANRGCLCVLKDLRT